MSAPTRRSARSLARAAGGEEAAAAVDAATVELSATAEPAEQPRKRPRRAAAKAVALVVEAESGAASEAAGSEAEGEAAAAPAAKGRGRPAKLKAPGPTRELEAELWQQGYASVAGVDEAGRGPLAGGSWLQIASRLTVRGGGVAPLLSRLCDAGFAWHPQQQMDAEPSLNLLCRPSCGCRLRRARTRGD